MALATVCNGIFHWCLDFCFLLLFTYIFFGVLFIDCFPVMIHSDSVSILFFSGHCLFPFLSVIFFLLPAWVTRADPRTPLFLFICHPNPLIKLASPYKKRCYLCDLTYAALMCCPYVCVVVVTGYSCFDIRMRFIFQFLSVSWGLFVPKRELF